MESFLQPLTYPDSQLHTNGILEGTAMDSHFRQAKIDHYIDQAQDLLRVGRYLAARRPLTRALNIDPGNSACQSIQQNIQSSLAGLANGAFARGRRSELVVIIDQDEKVLDVLTRGLQKYGFNVVSAGTYREAVELFTMVTPDLVISEVNFENGPAGFDIYLWVRTASKFRHIPFLFLTMRLDRQTLIAGKRLGVNDFVLKPLDEEVACATITSCLSRRRQ